MSAQLKLLCWLESTDGLWRKSSKAWR